MVVMSLLFLTGCVLILAYYTYPKDPTKNA